jgi:hypothetical protein
MWTDACGETHFEFWEGIKFNGKTHKSVPLFQLCEEFGDGQVLGACIHLGCSPHIADLKAIKEECERQESSYV